MIDTRLIFVDGMPTSGKSTTAHLITRQMQRAGFDVDWHYEEEPEEIHPVHVYGDLSSAVFCEQSLARFRDFAASAAGMRVETSGEEWESNLRQILGFLNVTYLHEPKPPSDSLEPYVEVYVDPTGKRHVRHGVDNISIWTEDGHIFLGGLKWPRMRLIPNERDHFAVEGITIELKFTRGSRGEIEGFTVCGRNVDRMPGETFHKSQPA